MHVAGQYKDTFIAEIAQLVEHNLAKVGVASSSLVFRSRGCIKGSNFLKFALALSNPSAIINPGVRGRTAVVAQW